MSVYDNLDISKVKNIRLHIEDNATIVEGIVDEIIQPYCKDLDRYVSFIAGCLKDGETPPTTAELEDFCLNLSRFFSVFLIAYEFHFFPPKFFYHHLYYFSLTLLVFLNFE